MRKEHQHHDATEEELRVFWNLVSRIEKNGKSLADGAVMLKISIDEYEVIDAKWHEFCIFTQEVTDKWRPFFAKCNRKTKTINSEEYECYVCFRRLWRARLWKFVNNFFDAERSKRLEPQLTKVSENNHNTILK